MKKEFVMRGQTASGRDEVLNFSGFKPGMAYKLTEFTLYPSTNYLDVSYEIAGAITAGKTAIVPNDPNFNDPGLNACGFISDHPNTQYPVSFKSVINDTFLITQDLIISVVDSSGNPVNWQCKFETVKMSGAQEAVTNYKQYLISDD